MFTSMINSPTYLAGMISLNVTLLLFLAFVWAGLTQRMRRRPALQRQIVLGTIMGGGAAMGILASADAGLYLDVRTTIVTVAAAFGGFVPGMIAATITTIVRTLVAPDTALVSGFFVTGGLLIGLWVHRTYGERLHDQRWPVFAAIGTVVGINVKLWYLLLLPGYVQHPIFPLSTAFILLIHPLTITLMGVLLARELRRHAMDNLLAREYDILQTALESIAMPVSVTRLHDSHFLYANPAMCELLGIAPENIHRHKAHLFYDTPDERDDLIRRVREHGGVTEHELSIIRGDGTRIETLINMQMIVFDGEPALASSLVDITQRKRNAQAAFEVSIERERMRMMSEVIKNITHDVNTPLSTMQTSLYLLERSDDPQRQARYRQTISEQIERLSRILDQLFEMARVDRTATHDEQPIALNSLVHSVRDRLARKAQAKQITLRVNVESVQDGAIVGDNHQLVQALLHIAENALHYTPAEGTVTLTGDIRGGDNPQAVIEVRDTGPGIAPEHLPHIFERFYRVDEARRVETGGAGLGLSIAQKIIEDHAGHIDVTSVPGDGSVFRVVLPYDVKRDSGNGMNGYVPQRMRVFG